MVSDLGSSSGKERDTDAGFGIYLRRINVCFVLIDCQLLTSSKFPHFILMLKYIQIKLDCSSNFLSHAF